MTVVIRAGEASLADWRAIWRGEPVARRPRQPCRAWPRAPRRSSAFSRAASRSTESTPASANSRACASRRQISLQLQRNIVLSHAAGVGEPASVATTRLMMALKLGSLAQGASGVQPQDACASSRRCSRAALRPWSRRKVRSARRAISRRLRIWRRR